MSNPSLFIIVPGFGAPHLDEKIAILENNLKQIRLTLPNARIKIRVCCYDANVISRLPQQLLQDDCIEWIIKKGIVGQFIHAYATPKDVEEFDYVMLLLDDIELKNTIDIGKMIEYHKHFKFDIISPSMTLDSKVQYAYLLHQPNAGYHMKVTSACEAFCYLMHRSSYSNYYKLIEPVDNPWLWGVDLVLYKYHKMHIAVLNNMQMKHHYKNECYAMRPDAPPTEGYNSVLRKYNVTNDSEFFNMKSVLYFIIDTSGL